MKNSNVINNHYELINIIKNTPTNTLKYKEAIKELSETEWASRFGNIPTLVCERDYLNIEWNLPNEPIHLSDDNNIFLKNKLPANGISPFNYLPRNEIEMDVRYIQLISAIVLHDGSNILTLRSKNRNKLGLPGGHIDYSFESLGKTIDEVAHESAVRELIEEVKVKENSMIRAEMRSIVNNRNPILFDNSSNGWDKFRHRCLIYENRMSMGLSRYGFSTNEREKHTVEIRSIEKLYEQIKDCKSKNKVHECDNWLKETIIHLVEQR